MMWNVGDMKEDSKVPVKSWERPWNTDEMRHQSAGWNLAGDSGLLRHLQQFSQNLLVETHAMEVSLDSLVDQLRAVSTGVSNVTNQFLCLSNTQFLENRVYDDDDNEDDKGIPSEDKKEEAKPKSKEEQEAAVVARIKESLALGISVLDNMFDSVEVPASDSEDDESGGRLVLEPHNPYLSRALPYLIGSRQFMEDESVGLGSLSDLEENDVNKNFILSSDSESEKDIEHKNVSKKRMRQPSATASEDSESDTEGGPAPGKQKKDDDSIAATNTGDMFGGDSPTEVGGIGVRDSFTADLAFKLGAAATVGSLEPGAAANKHTAKWDGEDSNNLFGQRDGKFTGGHGLFDDLEDSSGSLWGSKDKLNINTGTKNPPTEASLVGPGAGSGSGAKETKRLLSVATAGVATGTPEPQTDDLGLFVDSDISNIGNYPQLDGDLFTAPRQPPRNSVQVTVDQQSVNKKKKPAGAVSIFGSVDVFKAGIRKPPSCSSCSSDSSECSGDNSSGIGQTRSEHQDSTKSAGTSAAANSSKVSLFDPSADLNKAIAGSYLFQDETAGDDSLFSKPQKGLTPSSDNSASAGGSTSRFGAAASQKPVSLFSDSDSGDDEFLFSSTSSASSRSRRSQGSGDLLAASADKGHLTAVPRKGPVGIEDLFSGTKDEPGFDIFSAAVVKPEEAKDRNKDLFSGKLSNPQYDIFGPPDASVSGMTAEEKLKSDGKDVLFGGGDKHFDIFGGSGEAEPVRTIGQLSVGHNNQSSLKHSDWGLFSNSSAEDVPGDIFSVPVSNALEQLPSEATVVDGLFLEGSALGDSTDNLFAGAVKPKTSSRDKTNTEGSIDQIDEAFSVPRRMSNNQDASESKVVSEDCTASNSESVTKLQNDLFAEVPKETSDTAPSSLFSSVMGENGTDLFSTSTSNLPVNKRPIASNKPLISPKPKLPPVCKPPLLQNAVRKSDNFATSKVNSDENILHRSSSIDAKETGDNLLGDAVLSDGQQASLKSEQGSEIQASGVENTETLAAKEPSVRPSKLVPPKTLNIRKSTGFVFSSSSNEDEDLFGISLLQEVTLGPVTDENPSNDSSVALQGSSSDVPKLTPFSVERRSKSAKEISGKLDSNEVSAECDSSNTAKVRSVGASPRLLNIDPMALLPGAWPSLRESHSVEAAVSFDQPAHFNTTLPSAGKDRARIQAKRRPPSRRARQEAVRTSGIMFEGLDTVDDTQESAGVSSTASHSTPTGLFEPHSPTFVGGGSDLLSPSTDEEDLFGVPQDLPSEYGSSKDDDQSLFSCAPVLSPLEPLAKIPTERDLPKRTAVESPKRDTLRASKLLENSLHEDHTVPASHISSNEDRVSVSDFSSHNRDVCEIQPQLKVLDDIEKKKKKKTEPFSGTEKQEVSGTDSLFPSVGPIPELNTSYTIVGKPGHFSDSPKNRDLSFKDYLSSKDPFFLDDAIPSQPENIQQSQSHEELFRTGPVKHTHYASSAGRGSAEILDDLFSTARTDKSVLSDDVNAAAAAADDDDDDLFSSGVRTSTNKDIKKRTFVNKPVIIEQKEAYDVQDDISFLCGEEQKQSLPTERDLLSKNIKIVNTQNSNYSMFGGDSPECDDLFVATSAKKVGNPVIKGAVTSSTKSSLFDEDDSDDLFGSAKSTSISTLSAKPLNIGDISFTESSPKKKIQTKMNKPGGSVPSKNAATGEMDWFEDPLMVVAKK